MKTIQNNFSGGELSPRLHGRSDLQAYYKGAARLDNFLVSKEGTIRKRHGIRSFHRETDFSADKIFPYRFDRTYGGFVAVSAVYSGSGLDYDTVTITARLFDMDGPRSGVEAATIYSGPADGVDWEKMQSMQVGDQLWISGGGIFKILTISDFDRPDATALSISDWTQAQPPDPVSALAASQSESHSSGRKIVYCAYVVKDSIYSSRTEKSITWPNSCPAGEYITVTATISADRDFDYVLIGKKQGSNFGEVARFYPEDLEESEGDYSCVFKDENISPGDVIYTQTNILETGFEKPLCIDCFQQRRVFANSKAGRVVKHKMTTSSTYLTLDDFGSLISAKKNDVEYADSCTIPGTAVIFPTSKSWRIVYVTTGGEPARLVLSSSSACAAVEDLDELYSATYGNYDRTNEGTQTGTTITFTATRTYKIIYWTGSEFKTYQMPAAANSVTIDDLDTYISAEVGSTDATSQVTVNKSGTTVIFPSGGKYIVKYHSATVEAFPMTLWFSEVGNLDNFYANRPASEADAFSPTIAATGPAFIRWVVPYQETMILFTDSGLYTLGFSQSNGFSANTCRISRFSDILPSPDIRPVSTDAGIAFVGADLKTVYTVQYDLSENMMKPINRSVLVEHLTREAHITSIALQQYPDNILWVTTSDGRYATFTFERNEEVFAWSEGSIPGAEILGVYSIGTVSDIGGRATGVMLFRVKTGTGLSTRYYLCKLDGSHRDRMDTGTLSTDAGYIDAPVEARLVTLRPESQERTVAGIEKNVKDVLVRLYKTGSLAVKPASGGSSVPLVGAKTTPNDGDVYTGDVKVMPRGFVNEEGQLEFVSTDDKGCEILQIVTKME